MVCLMSGTVASGGLRMALPPQPGAVEGPVQPGAAGGPVQPRHKYARPRILVDEAVEGELARKRAKRERAWAKQVARKPVMKRKRVNFRCGVKVKKNSQAIRDHIEQNISG